MYRGMVVCDSDGTLLPFGQIYPDKSVIKMIHDLTGAGYLFFIASGRNYQSLREYYRDVDSDIGYICCNGAEIIYKGQRISGPKYMNGTLAQQIVEDTLDREGLDLTIITGDTVYLFKGHSDIAEESYYKTSINVKHVESFSEIDRGIFQIVTSEGNSNFDYFNYLCDKWGEQVNIFPSGPGMLDITQCNKGDGLLEMAQRFGIPINKVYAFGDSDNDIPMLKVAGHGYLLDSAGNSLKAKFSVHCSSVVDVCGKLLAGDDTHK